MSDDAARSSSKEFLEIGYFGTFPFALGKYVNLAAELPMESNQALLWSLLMCPVISGSVSLPIVH